MANFNIEHGTNAIHCSVFVSLNLGLPVLVEDKPHPLDENIRRVERGSRIVVAVRQDTKVVLQVIALKINI